MPFHAEKAAEYVAGVNWGARLVSSGKSGLLDLETHFIQLFSIGL